MESIKFAAGLPISGLVRLQDRYVAAFASDDIRAQYTSGEGPWACLQDAGFRWDDVSRQWWITVDPRLIKRIEQRLIAWKERERANLVEALASQSLAAQLGALLASPRGMGAGALNDGYPAIGPGWVYVLSNDAHPHLVKIGFSTEAPENRAAEISSSTGVPIPFVTEFKIYVEECGGMEAAVHNDLREFRINRRREFFKISMHDAAKVITKIAVEHSSSSSTLIAYLREGGELRRIESRPFDLPSNPANTPWGGHRPAA